MIILTYLDIPTPYGCQICLYSCLMWKVLKCKRFGDTNEPRSWYLRLWRKKVYAKKVVGQHVMFEMDIRKLLYKVSRIKREWYPLDISSNWKGCYWGKIFLFGVGLKSLFCFILCMLRIKLMRIQQHHLRCYRSNKQ